MIIPRKILGSFYSKQKKRPLPVSLFLTQQRSFCWRKSCTATKNQPATGIFLFSVAYSVTNGLAAAVASKTEDQEQEDHKDNDPPDPAPAAVAKSAAVVAATVVATAAIVKVAKVAGATATVVTFIKASAATGRYLLFIHSKNLLNLSVICVCCRDSTGKQPFQ